MIEVEIGWRLLVAIAMLAGALLIIFVQDDPKK